MIPLGSHLRPPFAAALLAGLAVCSLAVSAAMAQTPTSTADQPRPCVDKGGLTHLTHPLAHVAQRIAYCLRKMGAVRTIGKSGNAILYQVAEAPRKRRRKAA